MDKDSKFTRNADGYVAVRVVTATETAAPTEKDSMFTRDTNGNCAVRVVGASGGGGSVDETRIIVKSDSIPTANSDNLGKFYCYSGTTNANYTHGYVYECVAGSVYYEANIAFVGSVFASEDFYKAGKLIVDAGVTDPTQVTGGTMTYALAANLWSIVFTDANGNALNTAYNIYTDDLEQDYDILPVIDPSEFTDGQVVNMSINNIVGHTDYSWERLDVQPAAEMGRYLSGWNCATGLATTNPPTSPYQYKTGDYFIISAVATGGASNYKPNGSSYTTGVASTTVESATVAVNDTYLYDGTNWTLLKTGSAVTSVNGQTGDVTLSIPDAVQYSTMPTASATELGNIYQFIGATDSSYTNGYFYKCVSDGQSPATYSWEQTDVQPQGDLLPSQSGHSGEYLTTNGTSASWATLSALQNTATGQNSLTILGTATSGVRAYNIGANSTAATDSIAIGSGAIAYGAFTAGFRHIAIGTNAQAKGDYSISIGGHDSGSWNSGLYSIALGAYARATGHYAIQLGSTGSATTNSDKNTFKVANQNGNFEIMSANGTIPAARHATLPSADGTYVLKLVITSGVPTLSWVAE